MKYTCVIVEHDHDVVKQLETYVSLIPSLLLVQTFDDPNIAIETINGMQDQIDILIVPFDIKGILGSEIHERCIQQIKDWIIMFSSNDELVKHADYRKHQSLIKPISFELFQTVIADLLVKIPDTQSQLILSEQNRLEDADINAIIAVQAMSNYIRIFTAEGKTLYKCNFNEAESLLCKFDFLKRVNETFIISTKHLDFMIFYHYLVLKNGMPIEIDREYSHHKNFVSWNFKPAATL